MIKKLILPQSTQSNKNTQRTHQSQFPQRFSFGVLLRKTAVSFPSEETAAWLSTSLLLTLSKVRARSVSETFFLSSTHSLSEILKSKNHARLSSGVFSWTVFLVHFVVERTCPLSLRGIFYERYPRAFKSNSQDFYGNHINNFMILGEVG